MDRINQIKQRAERIAWDDRIFDFVCNFCLIVFVGLVFYPLYFVLIASFTAPQYVNNGRFLLYPIELSLDGYKMVLGDESVWSGYLNTILYTSGGVLIGTVTAVMAGYALSRKELLGRGLIMKICVFTMYFSGGTIPLFLVIRSLNLVDTRLIMIILGSVSVYNIIVVRSFIQGNIPEELFEAAVIDGCGHGRFFTQIVIPLSKAVIAVTVLWVAVGYWNSYFNAMIFLTDSGKYPLQLHLRKVLLQSAQASMDKELALADPEAAMQIKRMASVIKYSFIVVATAPILCIYPFVQKYFVKGVMVGAIKG